MQQKFREKIMSHWLELVAKIDPYVLADSLQSQTNNVFTSEEIEAVFEDKTDIKHNTRLLLFLIQKKDDATFYIFVDILDQFNLKYLFSSPNINYEYRSKVYHEPDQPDNDSILPVNVTSNSFIYAENFGNKDDETAYRTFSKNRGHVLIINNKKNNDNTMIRTGSEIDLKNLKELFGQMFLKVTSYEDLKVIEMKDAIERFSKTLNNTDNSEMPDMVIIIIMSHGKGENEELAILDQDDNLLNTTWIEEQFNNNFCYSMYGRPKIFIYQCCRGILYDNSIEMSKENGKNCILENQVETDGACLRRVDDTLICYATQKGYRAHRNTESGSWYIRNICDVFRQRAHNTTLRSMLDEVDRKLKNLRSESYTSQTSQYRSNGCNKDIYFNPGIYLDESGNKQRLY